MVSNCSIVGKIPCLHYSEGLLLRLHVKKYTPFKEQSTRLNGISKSGFLGFLRIIFELSTEQHLLSQVCHQNSMPYNYMTLLQYNTFVSWPIFGYLSKPTFYLKVMLFPSSETNV